MLPVFYYEEIAGSSTKKKERRYDAINQVTYDSENEDETMECRPKRGKASFLLPKECIFCKKSKYMKGKTKTREPLTLCIDIRAEKSIKSAATKKEFYSWNI